MPKSRTKRAQIFQSFDALKGFREILNEQEHIVVSKKELSKDDLDQLNYKIHQIKVGMIVQVIYYEKNQYVKIEGIVSKFNLDTKIIQIVKTKINLLDIINIEINGLYI